MNKTIISKLYGTKAPVLIDTVASNIQFIKEEAKVIANELGMELTVNARGNYDPDKFHLQIVNLSQMNETSIEGIHNVIPEIYPKGKGIVYFNELHLAVLRVQPLVLQIALDRAIRNTKLSDDIMFIVSGNMQQPVYHIMAPVLNKFIRLDFEEHREKHQATSVDSRLLEFCKDKILY